LFLTLFMPADHLPHPAVRPTARRSAWSLALMAAAVVIGLGVWCAWWVAWRVPEAYPFGDGALTELYTIFAIRDGWGLGPYSRFGWHHPGPLYFYLLAPYYLMSGQHGLGLHAGAMAINVLSLLAIAGVLRRHAHAIVASAMLIGLAGYLSRLPRLVTSVWNPHVLVLPYGALIVSAAVTASGRLALLPLTVVFASFVAQTHVGLAPSALVLTACAVIGGLWSREPRESRRPRAAAFWLGASVAVAFLCWLPAIHDELTTSPGNLTTMVRFFRGTQDTSLPPGTALAIWSDVITAPLRPGFGLAYGNESAGLSPSLWLASSAIAGLALVLLAGFRSARRGYLVEARLCQMTAVASAVAWLSVASIRGGPADHLTFWISLDGMLAASALAGVCGLWAASRIASRITSRVAFRLPSRLPAIVVSGLTIAVTLLALQQGATFLRQQRDALFERPNVPPVGRVYRATRNAIAKAGLHRPRLDVIDAWSDAAGVVLQLHKRYVPFGVDRRWGWMFGEPVMARGDEDGVVLIANPAASRLLAQEPGNCLITVVHQTSIYLRAPSAAQQDRVECLPGQMASQ
jgi:hypothetical protein